MGFAVNGRCFDDAASAAAYACGRDYPLASVMVDVSGHPASVVVECTGTTDNVLTLQRDVNGSVDGVSALALSPPACDVMEWHTYYPFSWSASDGALIAGAVVSVWGIAWGWKALRAVLSGRVAGSDAIEE